MRDRLYRSRDERVLFGVAGGVADWLDIDPALVRIVFALLVLTAGFGLPAVHRHGDRHPRGAGAPGRAPGAGRPECAGRSAAPAGAGSTPEPHDEPLAGPRGPSGTAAGSSIFGAILIVVGAWFLLRRYVPALDGDLLGPVVLHRDRRRSSWPAR